MQLIRGLYNCPAELFQAGSVVTIGNFDGVHLGHQSILSKLQARSRYLGLPSVVVLFEPHAQEFFQPKQAPARLFKLTDKLTALAEHGVEYVLCLRFGEELANLTAQDFVRRVLIERLNVRHLFIGDDFRFGHQRQGDFELLKSYDFSVEANQSVTFEAMESDSPQTIRISSSKIRELIEQGDFTLSKQLLGKNYRFTGKVAHGDKQGRDIGFPTANLPLKRLKSPLKGVYAVRVYVIKTGQDCCTPIYGVANVGGKPTVKPSKERLEVHLFDFDGDIYGEKLAIEPIAKIRDERKFESIEALTLQIKKDIEIAQLIFTNDI